MNTGLLILRLVLGLLLVGHGTQKLFGWFGGHGPAGTGGFFHSIGFRPGKPMAVLAGATEAGGGLLLALGLLTPLAALAVVGTLVVAAWVHRTGGLWGQNGGYELPLLYSASVAMFAFTGPGAFSLDAAFGLERLSGPLAGVLVLVLGLLAGLLTATRAQRTLAAESTSSAAPAAAGDAPAREAA